MKQCTTMKFVLILRAVMDAGNGIVAVKKLRYKTNNLKKCTRYFAF